jgi:methyl-accepting chemotaxis protein
MNTLRRILGILVMIAGILGLVLSLAGLVGVWVVKPTLAGFVNTTLLTVNNSITTSQKAMEITGQALGATVDSVDALSSMLGTTATAVEDTKPVFSQLNSVVGEKLPATLGSATDSLKTAQQAAQVMESSLKSLDTFRAVISGFPLFGGMVEQPTETYNPEKPLAVSLGEVASDLEELPPTFTEMAANMDKADNNLDSIQGNLTTMSNSVGQISTSLSEYQAMITQSQSSMENLRAMLTNIQTNLNTILNSVAIVVSLFLLWLLVAQIVILSQGWELYQGTAGRMEGGEVEPPAADMPTAA